MAQRRARPSPAGSRASSRSRSACPANAYGEHALLAQQRARCASVSWISPPAPGRTFAEVIEDARRQHVAADHAERRRRVRGLGLLDDAADRAPVARRIVLDGRRCRSCRVSSRGTPPRRAREQPSRRRTSAPSAPSPAAARRSGRRRAAPRTARRRPPAARTAPRGRGRAPRPGGCRCSCTPSGSSRAHLLRAARPCLAPASSVSSS